MDLGFICFRMETNTGFWANPIGTVGDVDL